VNISLDYVLSSRNVEGKIYLCDVKRFFDLWHDSKKAEELRDKLEQINDKLKG